MQEEEGIKKCSRGVKKVGRTQLRDARSTQGHKTEISKWTRKRARGRWNKRRRKEGREKAITEEGQGKEAE